MKKLNKKLISLRKERSYTQQQLSKILNVSRSSIADLYGVSLDWLTGRTTSRYNPSMELHDNIEVMTKIYEVLKSFDISKK